MTSTEEIMYKIYAAIVIALFIVLLPSTAEAQISVPGRQNFDFDIRHGERSESSAMVQNTSGRTQAVRIYQTDYSFSPGGEVYGDPGRASRSNAEWVLFSPSAFTLAPGEVRPVHFSATAPEDTTLAGSYWSMLMIEAQPIEALASVDATSEPTLRLDVVMRYGLQIHTSLPGVATSEVAFLGVKLQRDERKATTLQVDVENIGESMSGPAAWVEVYDENGQQVGRATSPSYRIYPGTSVRYEFNLPDLSPGKYEALVVLDGGADVVYGAQYSLNL